MALSIGVGRAETIEIGGEVLQVLDVTDPFGIQVIIGGEFFRLTEERQEVRPDVVAFCGRNPGSTGGARIAFEAPRHIKIRRKEPVTGASELPGPVLASSDQLTANPPNVFRIAASQLGPEDRFTACLHYLIDCVPSIGQAMVDLICDKAGLPRATFERAEDHPWGDTESKPDFRLVCKEFDILCEHKLGSDLGPLQLERYLKLKYARPFNLVLITDRLHAVSELVLAAPHYRFPKDSAHPYFLWEQFFPVIASHEGRLARDFVAFMKDLGMAPCPLPGDWADLFLRPEVAAGFYDATSEMREYFKTMGAVCVADGSRRGIQARHPCAWLQLLYFQVVKSVKPVVPGLEPPYLIGRAFIQSAELAKLSALNDSSITGSHGRILGRSASEIAPWDPSLVMSCEYVAPLQDYIAASATEMKARLLNFGREVFQDLESQVHMDIQVPTSRGEA